MVYTVQTARLQDPEWPKFQLIAQNKSGAFYILYTLDSYSSPSESYVMEPIVFLSVLSLSYIPSPKLATARAYHLIT